MVKVSINPWAKAEAVLSAVEVAASGVGVSINHKTIVRNENNPASDMIEITVDDNRRNLLLDALNLLNNMDELYLITVLSPSRASRELIEKLRKAVGRS